jgi:methyltransferase
MNLFWIFIMVLLLQRVIELLIARRNESGMRARGAIEYDSKGYKYIIILHVFFILSLIAEKLILERGLHPYFLVFFVVFLLTQGLRYWSISTLGIYWNTKILVLPGAERVCSGPYHYIRHPNYLAVCLEFFLIPLLFSCYFTAIFFSFLNMLVLKRRIKMEEKVLQSLKDDS